MFSVMKSCFSRSSLGTEHASSIATLLVAFPWFSKGGNVDGSRRRSSYDPLSLRQKSLPTMYSFLFEERSCAYSAFVQ